MMFTIYSGKTPYRSMDKVPESPDVAVRKKNENIDLVHKSIADIRSTDKGFLWENGRDARLAKYPQRKNTSGEKLYGLPM